MEIRTRSQTIQRQNEATKKDEEMIQKDIDVL